MSCSTKKEEILPPKPLITGCDSVKLNLFKPNKSDSIRLSSCILLKGCDSLSLGLIKAQNKSDSIRLSSCILLKGCDSLSLGILKPNKQDTLRLLSCLIISSDDAIRLGLYNVNIGTQIWMSVNLNVTTFRNGDLIPEIKDDWTWTHTGSPGYSYYNYDSAQYASLFGKIYNGYAVRDVRGLAPVGFHIPSQVEWDLLNSYVGGDTKKLRKNNYWYTTVTYPQGNNSTGFSALPGGMRNQVGTFQGLGIFTYWWTSTIDGGGMNLVRVMEYKNSFNTENQGGVTFGGYVRCIKD